MAALRVSEILDRLESFYGVQTAGWPTDPYLFLLWWHCGYPASDVACARGWAALNREIGMKPREVLDAPTPQLASALKAGGLVPELRAVRLKEIAARVQDQLGGDMRAALAGPIAEARRTLKKFPGIADAGADRILLFGGLAPVLAVPSNCPYVLYRILSGRGNQTYGLTYRHAQEAIEGDVAKTLEARSRAYLLLKRHGQEVCKRSRPKCEQCPLSESCRYFAAPSPTAVRRNSE